MIETKIAKLFKNGASQAVRLPADFRFEGDHVYASRHDGSGDIVLSRRPGARSWKMFFELLRSIEVPAEFMARRELNSPPSAAGVFDSSDLDGTPRQDSSAVSPDRRDLSAVSLDRPDYEHPIVGAR